MELMSATKATTTQPYILLRHRDSAPCIIEKDEVISKIRASDRSFVRRGIILMVLGVGSILIGVRLIRIAEEHGYFEWAANVDLRPIAFVILGFLLACVLFVIVPVYKRKRRGSNSPCPKCGKPLLSANLWTPIRITAEALAARRKQRMQKLLLHTYSKYVIGPTFMFAVLSFGFVALILRDLRHELDPNGWAFIVRMLAAVALCYLAAGYALTLVHVWAVIRRKGQERALKFLFPEAFTPGNRWHNGVFYRALGIRSMLSQIQETASL
jgi:hypothetical protein